MAIAVIGGLISFTALSLIFIPAFLVMCMALKDGFYSNLIESSISWMSLFVPNGLLLIISVCPINT